MDSATSAKCISGANGRIGKDLIEKGGEDIADHKAGAAVGNSDGCEKGPKGNSYLRY